ncbi:hypothetical protein DFA_11982 [Cavenderia fasciculata]|uniref:Pentacotripeptide-repeat region of PRORP domain-containing protein n=1 Tax=Cavenderia fasciculata TaxID=261658 RepID=F4QF59_CACFS|nr:uncharacterized protein DFA_11982 [Cavenderia fasciculata]EGG14213.1 hypothetical protein DFA_11982 [Cavenderia fasciculata]|eukprot:XP_004350921.1 hypothetical protein DFA_11982 [Cavenderia fasciculata]
MFNLIKSNTTTTTNRSILRYSFSLLTKNNNHNQSYVVNSNHQFRYCSSSNNNSNNQLQDSNNNNIKKKKEEEEITTVITIDSKEIEANIIVGDEQRKQLEHTVTRYSTNPDVVSPINPFEYSIKTVDDALQLPGLSRSVGLESVYIAGSIHQHLRNSMPLLKNLVQQNKMENAFSLFQVMDRYYVPVSEECYELMRKKIAVAMIEVANFNDAILRETKNPGSVPDNQLYIPTMETLNTVLNYYTETDQLVQAFRVFFSMRQLGLTPNQHTYRSLINASLRYEDIDVALFAFENLRRDGILLEEQTYERLFESCCNSVHIDGAVDLYATMVRNFNIPTINRWAYLTTLGITGFMNWFGLPKSTRSGREWVTSLQVSPSRYIFPPKHENHKLLNPMIPKEIKNKLSSGANNNNSNSTGDVNGLLPFF